MAELEVGKTISFRPTEYDVRILNMIQDRNPQIQDVVGLLRDALRRWEIESNDENSKSKRLDRIEKRLDGIETLLAKIAGKQEP